MRVLHWLKLLTYLLTYLGLNPYLLLASVEEVDVPYHSIIIKCREGRNPLGELVGNYSKFATSSQPGFPTSFQLVRLCGLRP